MKGKHAFADLFSSDSDLYARVRPSYPPGLIADIASMTPVRSLAWDAGTGNGQAARALAEHFDRVHATDASARQIAEAAPHERITFAIESAEDCTLAGASCDLVLVAQALHWFDLDAFTAEVRRVLKPGGVLAAIGYGWFHVDAQVDEIVGRTLLKPLQRWWAPNNWLLIDGYRTIDFPGEEIRCSPAAIHLDWTRERLLDYVRSWSAVRRWQEADGEGWTAAVDALEAAWPSGESRHLCMPLVSRLARL